jgi:hypothetical protein
VQNWGRRRALHVPLRPKQANRHKVGVSRAPWLLWMWNWMLPIITLEQRPPKEKGASLRARRREPPSEGQGVR